MNRFKNALKAMFLFGGELPQKQIPASVGSGHSIYGKCGNVGVRARRKKRKAQKMARRANRK